VSHKVKLASDREVLLFLLFFISLFFFQHAHVHATACWRIGSYAHGSDEKILTKLTWSRLAGTSTFHLFQSIGRSTYPLTEPIKCLCHDCWKKSLRFTCHRDRKFYQYLIRPRSNCIILCQFVVMRKYWSLA
jgi:hypothetical protein